MDDTVNPGADEICDRIDNDCSSGGGVDVNEDWDNDGYSPPGAACSGGPFPRTDCADFVDDANPGQTSFFAVPYCGNPSAIQCDCNGRDERGGFWCYTMHGTNCTEVCAGVGGFEASFDYDCQHGEEQEALAVTCYSSSGTMCTSRCLGNGPLTHSADCGRTTTYQSCACGGIGTPTGDGCTSTSRSQAMRCR